MLEENQKELVLLEDLGYLYPKETSKQKRRFGLYKCFCGNEFKTQTQSIKRGLTTSCGCYHKQRTKERSIFHGLSNHRLYGTWNKMVGRCTNEKYKRYIDYGARGITVCNRWLDVTNFIEDMYPTYIEGLTLDRKDNNKGYSKDNCRWTNNNVQNRNTRKIQSNNTSGYRGVSFNKSRNKFQAYLNINSKSIHLGSFDKAIDGAKAYDNYVINNKLEHTLNGVLLH